MCNFNNVTSIGNEAFMGCTSLTGVILPTNTNFISIGIQVFERCTSLTSITIPDSVTSIGDDAFYNCTSLANVTIPNSVTDIGYKAFAGTAWFNNQPDGLVYAGKVAYKYKGTMPTNTSITLLDGTKGIADEAFYNCTSLANVTIPTSVTSIGGWAFSGCTNLTSITIPNSVTSIGYNAFYSCASLTAINVDSGNASYVSENGVLYNKNKTELIKYPEGKTGSTFSIPDGVTSIRDYAFYGCTSLTSITIPDGVTSIRYNAFYGCTSLTSITIPDSVTSIRDYAFYGCTSLADVTFEGTITSGNFSSYSPFLGDLRDKYLAAEGGIGTYTTTTPVSYSSVWVKE